MASEEINNKNTTDTPTPVDFSSKIKFVNTVVNNMFSGSKERLMLGGPTGIGKTSSVKQFAKMFGLPVVVIEVPQAVEEQLINIPFVVYDNKGNKKTEDQETINIPNAGKSKDDSEPKVELGTSYLVSELSNLYKVPDAEWPTTIASYNNNLKEIMRQYEKKRPGYIDYVRAKYDRILFLDEFYRKATDTIRNILRNILDGKIGNDPIPPKTYIMYASNWADIEGTMDKQSKHAVFSRRKMKPPTMKEWLAHTVEEAMGQGVVFKDEVVEAFEKTLKDEHVSFDDIVNNIRTSPRRWSEILLYVNNAFPFKSEEDVGIMYTVLKRQFQADDDNTKISPLFTVLDGIIKNLAEQSGINPKKIKPVSPLEWKKTLTYQVMAQAAIGKSKKYIPVMQGLPGIGKTSIAREFEFSPELNLRFIDINAATQTRDSVIGIPLPKQDKTTKKRNVDFSEPELYIKIMTEIDNATQAYKERLKAEENQGKLRGRTAEEVYNNWENQRYKYLIFFDEINRVKDVSIFNSLRRVILEKEFNSRYKLPESAIIIGAMNPDDVGIQQLTQHFRDAVDLIDAAPNWEEFKAHLDDKVIPEIKKRDIPPPPQEIAITIGKNIIFAIADGLQDIKKDELSRFYLMIGENDFYISPRDYVNLFLEIVQSVDSEIESIQSEIDDGVTLEKEEINRRLTDAAFENVEGKFEDIISKIDIVAPEEYWDSIKDLISGQTEIVLEKKTGLSTLSSILKYLLEGEDVDMDLGNYMNNIISPTAYEEELEKFFKDKFKNFEDLNELPSTLNDIDLICKNINKTIDDFDLDNFIKESTVKALEFFFNQKIKKMSDSNDDINEIGLSMFRKYLEIKKLMEA